MLGSSKTFAGAGVAVYFYPPSSPGTVTGTFFIATVKGSGLSASVKGTSYAATVRNTSKSAQVTGTDYAATVKGSTHV